MGKWGGRGPLRNYRIVGVRNPKCNQLIVKPERTQEAWFTLPHGAKNHLGRDRNFSGLPLLGMWLGVHRFWFAGR